MYYVFCFWCTFSRFPSTHGCYFFSKCFRKFFL
nr:MAG TPA: hypothetical protein [Caudoviricetes sp.]